MLDPGRALTPNALGIVQTPAPHIRPRSAPGAVRSTMTIGPRIDLWRTVEHHGLAADPAPSGRTCGASPVRSATTSRGRPVAAASDQHRAHPGDRALLHTTGGFGQGAPYHEYLAQLLVVDLALSPSGPASPDCFRTWEALAMGALPIAEAHSPTRRYSTDYYAHALGLDPAPCRSPRARLARRVARHPRPLPRGTAWRWLPTATGRRMVAGLPAAPRLRDRRRDLGRLRRAAAAVRPGPALADHGRRAGEPDPVAPGHRSPRRVHREHPGISRTRRVRDPGHVRWRPDPSRTTAGRLRGAHAARAVALRGTRRGAVSCRCGSTRTPTSPACCSRPCRWCARRSCSTSRRTRGQSARSRGRGWPTPSRRAPHGLRTLRLHYDVQVHREHEYLMLDRRPSTARVPGASHPAVVAAAPPCPHGLLRAAGCQPVHAGRPDVRGGHHLRPRRRRPVGDVGLGVYAPTGRHEAVDHLRRAGQTRSSTSSTAAGRMKA